MPHTSETIKQLLDRNDNAVIRAMFAIQARQTADEQAGHTTRHTNGVGWSKFDAQWMGEMIEKWQRWGSLTPKQMAVTRNKVKRYHRQLLEIALENEARKSALSASPATMSSVTPERVEEAGSYARLGAICDCENYDGERLCDRCEGLAFQRREILAERRAFAHDPDIGAF